MKKMLSWILAVVITVASAIYQKKTGPTYPKDIDISLKENIINFELPRSGVSEEDLLVEVPLSDTSYSVYLNYRRFPVNESFTTIEFNKKDNVSVAYLPTQPPAGKLEYFLTFKHHESPEIIETEHVVTRFKGSVPAWILIPHILFIFTAMLLSNVAGFFAVGKEDKHVFYGNLTLILLLLGGIVFGPIVQYYAFGEFWTGIPFGWDLTDNKTLIAVIFWVVAVISNRKNPKYRYTIIAAIVTLLIFSIPHSMFGSELDYSSGEVTTGLISLLF